MKSKIAETIVFLVCSCVVAAFLAVAQGISWKICVPVSAIFFVVCIIISIVQERGNKKSFKTAKDLESGIAFQSDGQQKHFDKWKAKDHTERPKGALPSDIIARYRSRSIVWEFLGAFALALMLIIVYSELETAVRYILIGGIILLVYLGCSDVFGIRARRLYNKIAGRYYIAEIERRYSESTLIGIPKNWISICEDRILLLTPRLLIPISRKEIAFIRRAYVIGDVNYNGAAVSSVSGAEKYFIRIYMTASADTKNYVTPKYWCIMLDRFRTELAFEMLEDLGYPTDPSIDAR